MHKKGSACYFSLCAFCAFLCFFVATLVLVLICGVDRLAAVGARDGLINKHRHKKAQNAQKGFGVLLFPLCLLCFFVLFCGNSCSRLNLRSRSISGGGSTRRINK